MPFVTRKSRLAHILAIIFVFSIADLWFTIWANKHTRFNEMNPIALLFLKSQSYVLLSILKILLTTITISIFWTLKKSLTTEVAAWFLLFTLFSLMVRWNNYMQIANDMPFALVKH